MQDWFTRLMPNRFTSDHRLLVFHVPPPAPELERLEERLADGLAALRLAIDLHSTLPVPHHDALGAALQVLREPLERRRITGEAVRLQLAEAIAASREAEEAHGSDPGLQSLRRQLELALAGSERVADLLACAQDIVRRRGLGR